MLIDSDKLIKRIRDLKVSEKCSYLGLEGHQFGCSCRMSQKEEYNKALKDVINLLKKMN